MSEQYRTPQEIEFEMLQQRRFSPLDGKDTKPRVVSETMMGKIIEVGRREDSDELILEVEEWPLLLHLPCSGPVAKAAGKALYARAKITVTVQVIP